MHAPLSPRSKDSQGPTHTDLWYNFNKGVPCARTPCPYQHQCNQPEFIAAHSGKDHAELSNSGSKPKSISRSNNPSRSRTWLQVPPSNRRRIHKSKNVINTTALFRVNTAFEFQKQSNIPRRDAAYKHATPRKPSLFCQTKKKCWSTSFVSFHFRESNWMHGRFTKYSLKKSRQSIKVIKELKLN